jgi:hypothetical protein
MILRITSGTANDWPLTITIAGSFIPTKLTIASIKVRPDLINITMKLRRQVPQGSPDVHIVITQAEGSQHITKLQSLHKARKGVSGVIG